MPDNKQQQSDTPFIVSERSDPIFRLHFGDSLNVFIVRASKVFEGKMNVVPNLNIVALSKVSKYIESWSCICRDECSQKTTVEVAWPVVPEIISPWPASRQSASLPLYSRLALSLIVNKLSLSYSSFTTDFILFCIRCSFVRERSGQNWTGLVHCPLLFPSSGSTESGKSEQWSTFVTLSVFGRFSNNLLHNLIIIIVVI